MDTMEQMLSMLLAGAVEVLDISPDLQQTAIGRYEEVGGWLAEHADARCDIYPQGSFRLGTVVRPASSDGEYDIDLVCRMLMAKEDTSQAQLKDDTGDLLRSYVGWKDRHGHTDGPSGIEARRRCWTLEYSGLGFHLDVWRKASAATRYACRRDATVNSLSATAEQATCGCDPADC